MKNLLPLILLSLAAIAQADVRDADADMFPPDIDYDADIPAPREFLGFELGSEPVRHHQLVEYIRLVASLSDRLSVETIGYSHERRPILFVVATSEENRANLDTILEEHRALSDGKAPARPIADMPIVTWLNYGVHGAESSGMDAALPFVYHLAAARGEEIERMLSESVVLVTAIFNPDGHSKRVHWFDSYGGERAISDPNHIEHRFSWGWARTNHYGFDLNRQWLLQTQPESQAWMRKWHEWRPNLTVDYHEMGSSQTYYFHPGEATRTNPLALDVAEELMAKTAAFSEQVLDDEGRLYYHGERFDNYYVGKGSTFPLVNGGVGMLYEAGAALGRELDTPNGLRTFRENIRKHFRTSLASLRAGVALREPYLSYQQAFYRSALDEAARADTRAWVFSGGEDEVRLKMFADLLASHRIRAEMLTEDLEVDGRRYRAGASMLVRVSQPQYRLIRSLFETVDSFEDPTFYDVSTWTMPLAFNLDYAALGARQLRGVETAAPAFEPVPAPPRSDYGYVIEWHDYYAPRAVSMLLENELLARGATKAFVAETTNGERRFAAGSVVIPLDRQALTADEIHALIVDAAAIAGVRIHALASGRSVNGTQGYNVGGPSFAPLRMPRAVLLMGDGVSVYDAGEIWHLLDHRMQMPLTLVEAKELADLDLGEYSHLLVPNGRYGFVDEDLEADIDRWVRDGGTLVAFRNAAQWWQETYADEDDDAAEQDETLERLDYAEKDRVDAAEVIGGAIFAADLDTSHPLGFGYDRRQIALHKNTEEALLAPENPFATVIAYTDEPLLSGYASQENVESLAGTPALIADRRGRGSVILFADNPNFRGYWYGTNRLFLNSLFYSRAFSAP